ncbi:DUF2975 domain-containing protein [Pedobacter frigiditerrae]|uniref:DUF2975 domain-containing protein n=1 Tax=Pedobacter frigiditerrae TaxID=2530452 RepID=A0A4R0MX65_9SPHI|nr:DUF2975 domain-containing protein [Pedobacter frigiditerrae]TCC91869.1 DUF2975 domain-containing protein [Pedobacter frigiditerrae]
MKINGNVISAFCVIVILILVFGKMELYHYYPDNSYGIDAYSMEENKGDSIKSEIRIAQQKLDSIKRVERNYIDGFDGFSGSYNNFLGLVNLERKSDRGEKKDNLEYLVLSKIGLKVQEREGPNYLAFYTKNGDSYLSRTKLSVNGKENSISYIDKKVNYKYSSKENMILLPLRMPFWKVSVEIFSYAIIAIALFSYFFTLKMFFEVIIAISKNNGFENKNVNKLKKMAIVLAVLGTYSSVFNIIIYLFFSINHSIEGVAITYSFWEHDYFLVILSALCYLIYTAFKKAMILKQEQDLTI